MKFRYILTLLILAFILPNIDVKGQDPQFSQFYSSPLYLSPSLAGATEQSRLIMNYRNQWPNLPEAYSTYAFSFDHYIKDYNSGIGLFLLNDQEGGVYNSTNIGLSYSYSIEVNNKIRIRPGLHASYYNRNIDYSKLEFADQLTRGSSSSIEIPKNEQINHYDFAFSTLIYDGNYWLGVTGDHLLALNKQFSNDYTYPSLKITLYGGAKFLLFKNVRSEIDRSFAVSFLYKNQAGFNQLDLGANYEKEPFRIGLWFRGIPAFQESADLNAIVLLFGYTFKDILINYSYDISTSRLLASTGGAHEVSIAYRFDFGSNDKRKKMRAVPCPSF